MRENTELKALEEFSAGGHQYYRGSLIPLTDVKDWPEGSFERRLNNGFVEWSIAEEQEPEAKVRKVRPAVQAAE